ncbi:MAG: DUF885 family protein [Steroidobacteraceae bacterium]
MSSLLKRALVTLIVTGAIATGVAREAASAGSYNDLVRLFADWRAFERPPLRDGAPDYSAATFKQRHAELAGYRKRLDAIKPGGWPVAQQVDYQLLRAEMNGFDFYVRVLKPWERDPAFYLLLWTAQSDTPAHEGPTNHAAIELWTYTFPLSPAAQEKLAQELRVIPPMLSQAKKNLTGNARDLWNAGIGTLKQQEADLAALETKTSSALPALRKSITDARAATADFVMWLEREAPSKTGSSGIGKDHYTWLLRHVYLIPLSWDDEVAILNRELARAHASLKFEEQRNRDLPPLTAISSPEEYQRRANDAVTRYIAFLEKKQMVPMHDYMDPALRAQMGEFVPEEKRNFFVIAEHYEPLTLYTHFYHWWDLAQMRETPHESPIRRGPLLYNIWDSRAEGMATAMEEMMLHAGLFDDEPRAREIIWIMLAQRAARGLASLHAHANEFTMSQAKEFQVAWTPRGWMRPDLDLLGFEQQLYLRQPGYGTSYITGKYLIEQLMMERVKQLGEGFTTKRFFEEFNAAGLIPVSLIRWQLTGKDDAIRAIAGGQ